VRRWKIRPSRIAWILGTVSFGAATVLWLMLGSGTLQWHSMAATQDKSAANAVTIDNFSFAPSPIEIHAGTRVTWINKDDVPHTVVSVDGKFRSQALDTDETFSFTFHDPGTYEYFCSVHPKMTGKVLVK
jgi:plastocyanin